MEKHGNEFSKKIGNIFFEKRAELGLSREYVAMKADISSRYLFDIEMGRRNISLLLAKQICEALNIGVENIW